MVKTYSRTSHYIAFDDIAVELNWEPVEHIEPFCDMDQGVIRYATFCEGHEYEWEEGVEFIQANPRRLYCDRDPESWIEGLEADHDIFAVGVYEHGRVDYRLSGESIHAGDLFDYAANAGLIAIPNGNHQNPYTDTEQAARDLLAEYTDWCNGDVYGISTVERSDSGEWKETDSIWGIIGTQHAERCVKTGY